MVVEVRQSHPNGKVEGNGRISSKDQKRRAHAAELLNTYLHSYDWKRFDAPVLEETGGLTLGKREEPNGMEKLKLSTGGVSKWLVEGETTVFVEALDTTQTIDVLADEFHMPVVGEVLVHDIRQAVERRADDLEKVGLLETVLETGSYKYNK